ncbi:serine hydrolase domain-containing protein [Spirillospora sp. NPDC047279]|uniref:serine hydrolase domain-containing protein n=1 Tax=Spirillospora sp. NPDC047279 TaxID=3155478 RepID=UPI0033E114AA
MIEGTCDSRFAAVREAFAANFAERGERGAAVTVVVDGRTVADLWGGEAAAGRPWSSPDTLVNVFSVGKGLTGLLAARLAGQGRLDVDAPVVRYWPEFGAGGKEEVTVRHLLSHQAGLPSLRRRLPPGAMLDWPAMTSALAGQEPWWRPGKGHGYHVNTFGFLVGEVMRRVTGRTVGELLRDEIAGPLGADVHIGLPAAEHHRVADFAWQEPPSEEDRAGDLPDDRLMEYNAYFNPAGMSGMGVINSAAWRTAEIPSTNAHGTARGVARVYGALAAGGAADGVRLVDADALAAAVTEQASGEDLVLRRRTRFGLGFQLTQPERPLGPNPRAFGHFGAGGSLGFCDPDTGLAFGYVMNEMGPRWQNPRNKALVEAVYASL